MRSSFIRQLGVFALLVVASCDAGGHGNLIPREQIFGAPQRYQFRLSPDGTRMSYLAPRDGVLNIWVAPRGKFEEGKPLTNDNHRDVGMHIWAPNGRTILYRQDKAGTQNWRVYALDVDTGRQLDLTPFDGVQADILALSDTHPDEVLLLINRRDPRYPDVYKANLRTGAVQLVEINNGFSEFLADNDLAVRYAVGPTPAGGLTVFQKTPAGWQEFAAVPPEDALTFKLVDFDATDKRLYLIDSRGRDTAALTRYTPTTGETEILGQDSKADISNVLIEPRSRIIQAFTVNYQRREWKVIDPAIEEDLKELSLAAGEGGDFEIVDRLRDDSAWVVYIERAGVPGGYYAYDPATRALSLLFDVKANLAKKSLVPMHTAIIPARDGLNLVSYYSLPARAAVKENGKPARASPLVLLVHGGPWSRDKYGFDEWHQWLANRGYAVLSVNFRGSSGFGKAFLNAGDRQWGDAMLHDLEDAADWAVKEGIADPDKIAIVGGHYGGYAAIAGLAFQPERYACAVSVGGPSNLVNMLKSTPPYWTSIKDILLRRVGNPSMAEGVAMLEAQSPALHAQRIEKPLLIAQGANDPEVNEADTQEIVGAMKAKGVPVTYLLYPDEGSSVTRPANQFSFYAIAESFLGKCLGGSVEPIGNALRGSSVQIMDGAEKVPGLVKAMSAANSGPAR